VFALLSKSGKIVFTLSAAPRLRVKKEQNDTVHRAGEPSA
jgi:hypothetical protein